ncbi:MAG TPA: 4-hydroxy-3-methylbut-2-enyl diphosphate reductase [Pirellulales bacterium]|jgi:4-hydroxy-3-methylbut-2-enyl diphosphate reductase|nr:4-hydroxy-3-methylbut-2-enyl diphosphate reductase [Pirellulales bacterium]
MKILLVSPRGFCAGVNMAIEALERAITMFGTPLYVFHEIVHNRHVVERFRDKGVVFVDHVHEVPPGSHLMYSAHGISPGVHRAAQERELKVIDATCPLVRKVHLEAIRFARLGYSIILIGHRGHDEVVGTMGEAPDRMILVETIEDVDSLQVPDPHKVAYLTQTTLSVDDANLLINRLRERFPDCVGSPKEDICYATQNRQEALKIGVHQADVVLVFGSKNSSNSIRLAEVALESGRPTYLVDSADEVDLGWFRGDETVLITAGASAPEDLVRDCIDRLRGAFQAEVEQLAVREEHVEFPLPIQVRVLSEGSAASPWPS